MEPIVAVAGNPNVGKSTVFNALTGLKQHTGNWTGKTVSNAEGICTTAGGRVRLVDIPGTYSLLAHSAEEEVARNFLCFGGADAVIAVCDATCLERNLNLVLQILEITDRVLVCVNLMDEAARKGISVEIDRLSVRLGVPVVATVAQKKKSLAALTDRLDSLLAGKISPKPCKVQYDAALEQAITAVERQLRPLVGARLDARWLALRLLEGDAALAEEAERFLGRSLSAVDLEEPRRIAGDGLKERIVGSIYAQGAAIAADCVRAMPRKRDLDRRIDGILTHRWAAYPIMLMMLAVILWLTVEGANYPSQWLSSGFAWLQERLTSLFTALNAPAWLHGAMVLGAYRVLAWVVSVMLPPMAIFFPLFTLLEDAGFLPRIAYNLDRPFQRCNACGKQALTMCMGFGCNAVGVTGCRIIDSPRERLIAVLTNAFVPCNGRFPMLIALISMFFVAGRQTGLSALLLTGVILLGVLMTFLVSRLLSETVLQGMPSSFVLELPPYRRPQFGKVLVRSLLDRTLFVLGRAAAVAAPAGLILWIAANVTVGEMSLLAHCAAALDPIGRLLGMDGVILIAFILGFPANEIVLPIILMAYTAQGTLMEAASLSAMREILVANGWTWTTALCTLLFALFHWPCSTTLLTVKKETGRWGWAAFAAALPTAVGAVLCLATATISKVMVAFLN
ncbi:MAG: ferrous iron transport protein B [Clostridia bacterium]|nr:ferrous iron transport protein B [Clostridia bacterium]